MTRPLRRLRAFELALLLVAALFALAFHLTLPLRLPSEDDHQRVGAHLGQHATPGDAVVLFPWWTDRARRYAPEGLPLIGHLGNERDDLLDHPRLWVLSQDGLPGANRSAFDEAFLPGRTPVGEPVRFGTMTLRRYQNGRHVPAVWRATEALASAQVYLEEPNGARRPCPTDGQGFRCPGGAHMAVAAEWHEVLYEPRRCVSLHAPGGDSRVVVEFPSAPAGVDYTLEAGIIWEHAHKSEPFRTPTIVEASGAGLTLNATLPVGVEGFQRATARRASEGPLRIALSSREAESRQACVVLTAREAKP